MANEEQELQFAFDLGGDDSAAPKKEPREKKQEAKAAKTAGDAKADKPAKAEAKSTAKPVAPKDIANGKSSVISIDGEADPKADKKPAKAAKETPPAAEEEKPAPKAAKAKEPAPPAQRASPANGRHGGGEDEPAEEAAPEETGPPVIRLRFAPEGCFKVQEGGERVDLSEEEWRTELAHLYARENAS